MIPSRFPFPDRPRLWGVAVSHYQVEGGDPCDWSEWERAGKTRGGACGPAVDSWNRYEEDALLALDAGANAFRFSVSWSRVEPRPGEFDDAPLERYSRFVDELIARGIEPAVTLFHYTHPLWFHELTPWTSPKSVDAFGRFAARVAEALGDRVRLWIPLNEPLVFLLAGYFDAQIPPGIADGRSLNRVLDHLLAAHVAAADAIRAKNPRAAIGIAQNMMGFAPERRWSALDRLIATAAHHCYNRGIIDAISTGRWNFLLPPGMMLKGHREELPASLDFFGINFYSRLHLRCPGYRRLIGEFEYRNTSGHGLTDNGWEIVPRVFGEMIDEATRSGLPLVVTENGLADAADALRPFFLKAHHHQLRMAKKRGIPIHGYFHWSLLDNYEWLDGFGPRFGLYEVDRATMARRPRPSVELFRELGRDYLSWR